MVLLFLGPFNIPNFRIYNTTCFSSFNHLTFLYCPFSSTPIKLSKIDYPKVMVQPIVGTGLPFTSHRPVLTDVTGKGPHEEIGPPTKIRINRVDLGPLRECTPWTNRINRPSVTTPRTDWVQVECGRTGSGTAALGLNYKGGPRDPFVPDSVDVGDQEVYFSPLSYVVVHPLLKSLKMNV